jgi:hypothetical protein
MKYRLASIAVVVGFIFVASVSAQRKPRGLLDPNQPAVIVSFVRTANLEPIYASDGRDYLLFQIRNNTRWEIWLQMSGVPTKAYGDAGLFYSIVETKTGTIRRNETCHVCSVNPVGPGKTVVFPIPRNLAASDALLRLEYSFAWEKQRENGSGSVSTHGAEFYFDSLPKRVLGT